MPLFHHSLIKKDIKIKFTLRRERINNGGYDASGFYWGLGAPLYFAQSDGEYDTYSGKKEIEFYLRAFNRVDAKAKILAEYPGAKFYN
jgi:hypothetical protein